MRYVVIGVGGHDGARSEIARCHTEAEAEAEAKQQRRIRGLYRYRWVYVEEVESWLCRKPAAEASTRGRR